MPCCWGWYQEVSSCFPPGPIPPWQRRSPPVLSPAWLLRLRRPLPSPRQNPSQQINRQPPDQQPKQTTACPLQPRSILQAQSNPLSRCHLEQGGPLWTPASQPAAPAADRPDLLTRPSPPRQPAPLQQPPRPRRQRRHPCRVALLQVDKSCECPNPCAWYTKARVKKRAS